MNHSRSELIVLRRHEILKWVYISTRPKINIGNRRNKASSSVVALLFAVAVLILATTRLGEATESTADAIRHNHSTLRASHLHHHVQKHNKDDQAKRTVSINRCSGEYPKAWEEIMNNFNGDQGDDDSRPESEVIEGTDQNGNSRTEKNLVNDLKRFTYSKKTFSCPAYTKETATHWHSAGTLKITPDSQQAIPLGNLSLHDSDGSMSWTKTGNDEVYNQDEYCVWKNGRNWIAFKVCIQGCYSHNACKVRKCCPRTHLLHVDGPERKCIPKERKWVPSLYRRTESNEFLVDVADENVTYIVGEPSCTQKYYVNDTNASYEFRPLLNGTLVWLWLEPNTTRELLDPGEYCIDGVDSGDNSTGNMEQIVLICQPKTGIRIKVYGILHFVSAAFLLVTVIVYILIWRKQDNIHSWLQFSYATSLFFTYTTFGIVQLWSEEIQMLSASLCKIMGWINHLTYLSAFFWLTSMNFDLWWRFSRPLRSNRLQAQHKQRRRFLAFSVFSILTPLSILGIGILLDSVYGKSDSNKIPSRLIILPGFGKERCYFETRYAQIPYLYLPAGILLLADFIFFLSTVLHLRKMHSHSELARTQSTSSFEDRKGVRVIAKLFVVMGVLWLFELVSWICMIIFPNEDMTMVFMPVDIIISIQGVLIFFIFICKPNVRNQLRALFPRNDSAKTWDKEIPLQSVSTLQQQQQFTRRIENGRKHQFIDKFDVR